MKAEMEKIGAHSFEIFKDGDQKSENLALFLHGFPEVAQTWEAQMPAYVKKGYKVWAPNLRGYGKSYSPLDIESYHPKHLIDDIAGIIDAAKCKTVTLIAHDWGGIIAWYFALEQRRPLDKLIILNAPHPYVSGREMRTWRQLKKSWYMFAFQIPVLPEKFIARNEAKDFISAIARTHTDKASFNQGLQEHIQNNLLRADGVQPLLNWYRAALRYRQYNKDLYARKIKLDVPTLLIWGEKDTALGIHTSLGTEKHINDFTVRYIKEAGHFVQHDAAQEVNQIMHAWLDGKDIPGSDKPQIPYEA